MPKQSKSGGSGKSALELLEEATHLLRTAPAAVLAVYFAGAVPFVLGGLYFWADMSRSPFATQHLAGATLGMAALFVWMKLCQALFARRLRGLISGQALPPLTARHCGRMLLTQMALQPTGLFLLPLAAVPVLPSAWVYAFYQNLTVLDDGESAELRGLLRKAHRQATLWSKQNFFLVGFLLAFGLMVLVNWATVCYALPGLLKTLLGVESMFTRLNSWMLNSTFFAATLGLSYLCVDPIAKAAYALRCFYGESVQSGEDLKAGLREFIGPAQLAACAVIMLGMMGMVQAARAPGEPPSPSIFPVATETPEGWPVCRTARALFPPNPGGVTCPGLRAGDGSPLAGFGMVDLGRGLHTGHPYRGLGQTQFKALSEALGDVGNGQGLGETAEAVGDAGGQADTPLNRSVNESQKSENSSEEGVARSETGQNSPKPGVDASHNAQAPEPGAAHAQPVSASVPASALDATIGKVIQGSKYAWRAPRDQLLEEDANEGLITRFFNRVWDLLKGAAKKVFHGLGKVFEWLGRMLQKILGRFIRLPSSQTPGYGWIMSLNVLLYVLVAAVLGGLLYLAYRIWRSRRPGPPVLTSEPIQPVPDVADENVGADQLPEEGWMKLARELLTRGELRLALRAFYLASLAHLAERHLISIAKSKSNREYERELRRRGHSFPDLLAVFGENVAVFDRSWYGLHEVSLELVNQFAARVDRIKGGSAGGQSV